MSISQQIRVVVVNDHPLFCEGVVNTLKAEPDFEVVGEGARADEALALVQKLLPDLILLDIDLPGDGLDAARAVREACPLTKVVILTVSESEDDVLDALKSGVRGYILKGVSKQELRRILRGVYSGDLYVSPTLGKSVLREMTSPSKPTSRSRLDELTEREREILEYLAQRLSNRRSGKQLSLTEKTVKHYMTNIMHKLQVRNRVQAAMVVREEGSEK